MLLIKTSRKKLGSLLKEAGLISQANINKALEIQKDTHEKLGEIIVNQGWLNEKDLVKMLASQLDIPHIDLSDNIIAPSIAALINETMAKRYNLIPVSMKENNLKVAMSDPLDIFAIDDLKRITKMNIIPAIAGKMEINREINRIYGEINTKEIAQSFKEQEQNNKLNSIGTLADGQDGQAPIVEFIDRILNESIIKNASDIHIEPFKTYIRIRFRIDGQLIELLRADIGIKETLTTRIKILAGLDITKKRMPQDGRIQLKKDNKEIDLRVSTLPIMYGEKIVIRILYHTDKFFTIDKLGFHLDDKLKIKSMLKVTSGIILATGPTGSGKSTTLASMLREINTPNNNIITVEDPVEHLIEGINQVTVNTKTGLTFAKALRSILRQDPDIIMIGEMRDLETSEIAIRSAITGHLVLSTLHTNDAATSITRLVNMGCEPYMIGACLRGIIAQRLVRKICTNCKKTYKITKNEHLLTQIPLGTEVCHGIGCQKCNQTGYKGRIGVYEVLIIDSQMQEIISRGMIAAKQLKEKATQNGMRTLKEHAKLSVIKGETTVDEMLRISYEI